jgi:putative FmdB family regulatory protein
MPIYEYKCLDCGAHVEKMQKVADGPLTVCEKCGGKLEKQWSLSGFQFKGAGWYVTDYADKSADKSKEKAAEKSEKSSAAESTVKTEAASKKANDAATSSKKETVSKKE